MTAEDESIFNEVDNWANERSQRAKTAEDRGIAILRLNGHDYKTVARISSRALTGIPYTEESGGFSGGAKTTGHTAQCGGRG